MFTNISVKCESLLLVSIVENVMLKKTPVQPQD